MFWFRSRRRRVFSSQSGFDETAITNERAVRSDPYHVSTWIAVDNLPLRLDHALVLVESLNDALKYGLGYRRIV